MTIERTGRVEPLTPRVTRFLTEAPGAISMDDIQSPEVQRIDFECLNGLLAIEMKTLENDPSQRMDNFVDGIRDRPDFPQFYGTVSIEAALKNMETPDELRRDAVNRVGRAIINHLKKANDQLGSHEASRPRRNRVRMVLLINEDHAAYDPETVGWIIQRALKQADERGPRYANIDAVVYLSERHATSADGLIAFPILTIEGPCMASCPWKSDVITRFVRDWVTWNDQPMLNGIPPLSSFETIEPIPDNMPRHEQWRLAYRRKPYLRGVSEDQLRDRFDEIILVSQLWGIVGSPVEISVAARRKNMEEFTHVQEEMNFRALPIRRLPFPRNVNYKLPFG